MDINSVNTVYDFLSFNVTQRVGESLKILIDNSKIDTWTLEDLDSLYGKKPEILEKFYRKRAIKSQYYIKVILNDKHLVLICLNDKEKVITGFGIIDEKDYWKVQPLSLSFKTGGYIATNKSLTNPDGASLAEVIFGKKAEKGGWYLMQQNVKILIEGKFVNKKIKMIPTQILEIITFTMMK